MLGSLSKILHGPTTHLLRLVTPFLLTVQPPRLFQTKENHLSIKTTITTATDSSLLVQKYLTKCPPAGFLSTRDLAYWAIRKVFRASARTKAVWAGVRYSSRRSKLDRFSPSPCSEPLEHVEFQITTRMDCIHHTSVLSLWQPYTEFNELVNRRLGKLNFQFFRRRCESQLFQCASPAAI